MTALLLVVVSIALPAQSRESVRPLVNVVTAGTVTSVVDGDTVDVRLDGGRVIRVRLDGIDAPERGEPFTTAARNATRVLLFDKRVEIRGTDVDRYDRLVARVVADGQDSSAAIVTLGLACHFTRYSSDPVLAAAQRDARAAGRGFWAARAQKPACVGATQVASPQTAVPQSAPPATVAPRAAVPRAAVPRAALGGPYHGNRRSHVYHAPSYRNYNCPNCTVVFQSAVDAERAGFGPAGDCLRDQSSKCVDVCPPIAREPAMKIFTEDIRRSMGTLSLGQQRQELG